MRSRNRQNFEVHGEIFFVTSTIVGFVDIFKHKQASDIFVETLRFYQSRGDFTLIAWVLMPNHFHLVIKIGEKKNISKVIGNLKRYSAREIGKLIIIPEIRKILNKLKQSALIESGNGTALWKPRFDSLVITSEKLLRQKIEYIHNNPLRKRLVEESWQWFYSSAAQYAGKDNSNFTC